LKDEVDKMSLHKKTKLLMYFALPNEQFTTPQLLKYGVAAEEAFGQATTSNLGNLTRVMLGLLGFCLPRLLNVLLEYTLEQA
jgi:hypothetical protein